MVNAFQYMIGNALVGMTNPFGIVMLFGGQARQKSIGGVRSSSPLWRIRET